VSARDLLANATPRPWWGEDVRRGELRAPQVNGSGLLLAEVVHGTISDLALIVAAVNEYETLLDIAEAVRPVGNAYGCFAGCTGALPGAPAEGSGHTSSCASLRDSLARLDAIRSGT